MKPKLVAQSGVAMTAMVIIAIGATTHLARSNGPIQERIEAYPSQVQRDRVQVDALDRKLAAAEKRFGSESADLVPVLIEVSVAKADPALLERALLILEKNRSSKTEEAADILLMIAQMRAFDVGSEPYLLRAVGVLEGNPAVDRRQLGRALALLQGFYMIHGRKEQADKIASRINDLVR